MTIHPLPAIARTSLLFTVVVSYTIPGSGQDSVLVGDVIVRSEKAAGASFGGFNSLHATEPSGVDDNEQGELTSRQNESTDLWHRSSLTGDWNHGRVWISDHGLELTGVAKGDLLSNMKGGVERSVAYIQNLDLSLAIDCDNLMGWHGGSLLLEVLSNNGGKLSPYVGDAQVVSNIEAARMTKLYQAWVQQDFWEGSISLLAGVYDLNSEFYFTSTSTLFLNSSHGIGKEFSQTGRNGPSIFPNPGAGLRLRMCPSDDLYFQTVVLDGMPGDPGDPSAMSIHFNKEEGLLVTLEAGYLGSGEEAGGAHHAKYALGYWKYTSPFHEVNDAVAAGSLAGESINWGFYLLAEESITRDPGNSGRGLAAFARLGYANSYVNEFDYYLGIGVVYQGIVSSREEDQLGFAVSHVRNGREYTNAMQSNGEHVKNMEVTAELTYNTRLTPWLSLQPDVQYVIHPGGNVQTANAIVAGSRFELKL